MLHRMRHLSVKGATTPIAPSDVAGRHPERPTMGPAYLNGAALRPKRAPPSPFAKTHALGRVFRAFASRCR
jgi:hypothetical protein